MKNHTPFLLFCIIIFSRCTTIIEQNMNRNNSSGLAANFTRAEEAIRIADNADSFYQAASSAARLVYTAEKSAHTYSDEAMHASHAATSSNASRSVCINAKNACRYSADASYKAADDAQYHASYVYNCARKATNYANKAMDYVDVDRVSTDRARRASKEANILYRYAIVSAKRAKKYARNATSAYAVAEAVVL